MKYRLIDAEKDHHSVSQLARVLGVSRQGYYAWTRRGPSARARQDAHPWFCTGTASAQGCRWPRT